MEVSNGDIIKQQLTEIAKVIGVPRSIISDDGSDIRAGVQKYLEATKGPIAGITDMKHKAASLLKKAINRTPCWGRFTSAANACRNRLKQTPGAAIMPPNQRSKCRYMNAHILTEWAAGSLVLLRRQSKTFEKQGFDRAAVVAELSWLREYQDKISDWGDAVSIAQTATKVVAQNGYSSSTPKQIRSAVKGHALGPVSKEVRAEILEFVAQQTHAANLRKNEVLPGSTEVLESLIGSVKNMEGDQASKGFTDLILAAGAKVTRTTLDVVSRAMTTTAATVKEWRDQNLGDTFGAKRRRIGLLMDG